MEIINFDMPLDAEIKFSPELILNWAIITGLNIKIKPQENEVFDIYDRKLNKRNVLNEFE